MFLRTIRSAAKIGKANACLSKADYEGALEALAAAKKIAGISDDSRWLYHSVLGKSLYHQKQEVEALENLLRAEELLTPYLKTLKGSEEILNYMLGITWYIEKIENRRGNHIHKVSGHES